MNQNKKFDNILSECLDRIFKGETLEQCLRSYPEEARELEPLLNTVIAAKKASNIQPRAEFKASARYQFQSALRDMEAKKKQRKSFFSNWIPQIRWQSGWSMAIIGVLIVVLGGGGTVAAASTSMPDNALYSLKIATENVQLAVTPSDVGKAELNAKFANRRVEEISYVVTLNNPQEVQNVASLLTTNMENMTAIAGGESVQAYDMQSRSAGISKNNSEAATNTLNSPQPMLGIASAPPGTSESTSTATAPDQVNQNQDPTATTEATILPAPLAVNPSQPTDGNTVSGSAKGLSAGSEESFSALKVTDEGTKIEKIRQIIEDNYQTCITSLQAALEKASPEVRPAIRQAIARVEAEYIRAINGLAAAENNNQ